MHIFAFYAIDATDAIDAINVIDISNGINAIIANNTNDAIYAMGEKNAIHAILLPCARQYVLWQTWPSYPILGVYRAVIYNIMVAVVGLLTLGTAVTIVTTISHSKL